MFGTGPGAPAPLPSALYRTVSTVAAHQRAPAPAEMHCEGEEARGAAIWRLQRLLHGAAIVDGAGAAKQARTYARELSRLLTAGAALHAKLDLVVHSPLSCAIKLRADRTCKS